MDAIQHWHIGNTVQRSAPSSVYNASLAGQAGDSGVPTIAQVTLFLLWMSAILLWLIRLLCSRSGRVTVTVGVSDLDVEASDKKEPDCSVSPTTRLENDDFETNTLHRKDAHVGSSEDGVFDSKSTSLIENNKESIDNQINVGLNNNSGIMIGNVGGFHEVKQHDYLVDEHEGKIGKESTEAKISSTCSKVKPPPTLNKFLEQCAVFGLIMMVFYLCDYKHSLPLSDREYSRDLFMFLIMLLFVVAAGFTVQTSQDKILNRDQTEEWKGWMQVMFVWYHYFIAKETYNYIRIYIACYVWMTGFGNFSFFWLRKDFSLWRLLKMLFRLNFLVVMTMAVTNNSYMLYYICAMHTYWFLSVYAFMGILPSWNENRIKMAVKFACYFVINAIVFDTPLLAIIFRPLWFILSFNGSMHEWEFRAGLDHYATFVGMLCAYNYPHFERFMNYLDKRHLNRSDYLNTIYIKLFLVGLLGTVLMIWHNQLMWRDKYDYNSYHPYTSWVPILIYIIFRNLFPALRTRYLGLFAFLGKITLETYIAQLHIYMQYNAHKLIVIIPDYPLMNFALTSFIYLCLSHRLFHLTMEFSAFILPKDMKKVVMNATLGLVVISLHLCFALLCREIGII